MSNSEIDDGAKNWDHFYKANESMIPYTNVCVFAFKSILKCQPHRPVVFEFGCGSGNNLYALFNIFSNNIQIKGCDVSVEAIQQCKRKMPQSQFWKNDADLGLTPNSIDIFIERGSLHCVPKIFAADYMRQIYIGMKPGGKGFIEMPSVFHGLSNMGNDPSLGHREFYTQDQLAQLLQDFEIQQIFLSERKFVYRVNSIESPYHSYDESSYQVEFIKK